MSDENAAPEKELDAVSVVRTITEGGGVHTEIVVQGDIRATEVSTILELGLARWREQIGLVH